MRCLACFSGLINNGQFYCAINPEIGRELDYRFALPATEKDGTCCRWRYRRHAGGPYLRREATGLYFAKRSELGGALRCERNVPFKQKLDHYLNQQAERIGKRN